MKRKELTEASKVFIKTSALQGLKGVLSDVSQSKYMYIHVSE